MPPSDPNATILGLQKSLYKSTRTSARLSIEVDRLKQALAEAMYKAQKDVVKAQKEANADMSELLAENTALKAKNAVLTEALKLVSEVSTKAH